MPRHSSTLNPGTGRSVDRLINFSDAVVAVAVTLLALPLVDIPGPTGDQTAWTVVSEHASEIWTFLFTFYVVAVMWLAHNRILNSIARYDVAIFWMNTTWLVAIVLLPWVSAMFGESESRSSVGVLYWGTMAAISLLGTGLGTHLRRHPELLSDEAVVLSPEDQRRVALRGPVLGLYFLLTAAVSIFAPDVANWMPLGIIPLSIWLRPAANPDREADPA
ncbi:MAG: TMEM175 family protein [Actinomycetota bacterium]|nr:TMEM175 family protein [Actinomycetota bacterium]